MTGKSTTAIIVAYNSAGVIAPCLAALAAQPDIAEIIVVDNCSFDDTCDIIRHDFPHVTLIENQKNDGFGRANNIGLARVKTPFALLINPDAVLEEGALSALLAASARYEDAAILAPELRDENGDIHRSHKRSVFKREKSKDRYITPEGDICTEFLSGAVMLFNMEHMKNIGFFDPHIFLFYEDDDICMRVCASGLSLVLVPQAKALHLMGASSGAVKPEVDFFKQKHMTWSRLYIEHKYHGQKAAAKLRMKLDIINASKAGLYTLLYRKHKVTRLRGRLEGAFEFNEAQRSGQLS